MTAFGIKKRAILAWESGSGRGHVTKLKTVAEALSDRFSYYAVLHDMTFASALEGVVDQLFPCDGLAPRQAEMAAVASVGGATWAEYLAVRGFCDADFLLARVTAWRKALQLFDAKVLIADYAPAAMLAARTLGIPVVVVGTGYGIPAKGTKEYPIFLEKYKQRTASEAAMCVAMNSVIAQFGGSPVACAPDLYDVAVPVVTTIPELDPYQLRVTPRLPSGDGVSSFVSDGCGNDVFVYFSTMEKRQPELMKAIKNLGVPTRIFMPSGTAEELSELATAGLRVEKKPVPVDDLAKKTRLMLHAGQHGIVNLGLAAGIPQIAVPQHLEHLFTADCIKKIGVAEYALPYELECQSFIELVQAAYTSKPMRSAAQDFAAIKRPEYTQDLTALIKEACSKV